MSMICLFSPRLFINTLFPLWTGSKEFSRFEEDRLQRSEVRCQRSDDRGHPSEIRCVVTGVNFTGQGGREGTEVGSRRSVVRGRTEDRGRRTEDRRQRAEDRRQRAEDRGRRAEDREDRGRELGMIG
jgi:hypothetical protein